MRHTYNMLVASPFITRKRGWALQPSQTTSLVCPEWLGREPMSLVFNKSTRLPH